VIQFPFTGKQTALDKMYEKKEEETNCESNHTHAHTHSHYTHVCIETSCHHHTPVERIKHYNSSSSSGSTKNKAKKKHKGIEEMSEYSASPELW